MRLQRPQSTGMSIRAKAVPQDLTIHMPVQGNRRGWIHRGPAQDPARQRNYGKDPECL